MLLELPRRTITFPRRPLLMGIVNINDDSFSGDGSLNPADALARARAIVSAGGDFVDVGAESARTNRAPISVEEEIRRLQPFLESWPTVWHGLSPRDSNQIFPPVLSINTWRMEVIRWAVAAGADLINDMSGLPSPEAAEVCGAAGTALLIMHTVGLPKQNHSHVRHDDIVATVEAFFAERLAMAERAGLPRQRIVLDPGLGFAKPPEDDLRLCAAGQRLLRLGRPVLWPVSRKGFLGKVVGETEAARRDAATVGAIVSCALRGAAILRVHHVDAAYQALRTLQTLHPPTKIPS